MNIQQVRLVATQRSSCRAKGSAQSDQACSRLQFGRPMQKRTHAESFHERLRRSVTHE
jgi:hypothetical protein